MNNLRTILSRYIKYWLGLIILLVPILLEGCQIYRASESVPEYSYLNPSTDITTIGRVTIVELANNSAYPKISADVTEALFLALQKKQIFGLTKVYQDDPAFQSLKIEPDAAYYTFEQLYAISKTLKCHAVLVGTITQYKPYPHMAIGLRLRLLDLNNGQLLWAVEQVWDSTDKTTKSRIKNHFQGQAFSGVESLREQVTVISQLEFIRFVTYEIAETLQPKR
jgi:hypothetical protein